MASGNIAISIDHGTVLNGRPDRIARVAEILTRPCFRTLKQLRARRYDRWTGRARPSREAITQLMANPKNDAASFDCGGTTELVAWADIESGPNVIGKRGEATRYTAGIVVPYDPETTDAVVAGACELANTVDARAGVVALEPSFGLAHRIALGGGSWPEPRIGLSDQRRRERRVRGRKAVLLDEQVANLEWGTFLNERHLARIDLESLRRSGVFERITAISPQLVFLQVTKDPADDVSERLEPRLEQARALLAPIMMDISDIDLEEL